jgi:uncharacterized protein YprB with RNaseH-like and TPR domain
VSRRYFGIPKTSVIDGLHAQTAYFNYRFARANSDKLRLGAMLLDYNGDDLDGLIGAAQSIRALATEGDK